MSDPGRNDPGPAPLPEVIFHTPSGSSSASASTTLAASASGLTRSMVPGPVPKVDAVVHLTVSALVALLLAAVAAWFGAGRDGRLEDREGWTVLTAAGLGALAVALTIAAVVAAIGAVRQVRQAGPARFGLTRVAVAVLVTVAAVGASGALIATKVQDARDVVAAGEVANVDRTAPTIPDRKVASLTAAAVGKLAVGTCLRWPLGPTTADDLGGRADPSTLTAVPCSTAHGYEVIGAAPFPEGAEAYPSFADRRAMVDPICEVAMLGYLTAKGAPPAVKSDYGTYGIAPSASEWKDGDRTGTCIAVPPTATTTRTSSLAGAGS